MDNSKLDSILKEYDSEKNSCILCGSKIKELLIELLEAKGLEYHAVNDRIKDKESLRKKYNLKDGKYSKLEDITDIIGIRIITYYSDDIDKVAQLIEENFDVDQENSIDKREVLEIDRFGYLSLHYVVKLKEERANLPEYRFCKQYKIEIQIRSILQHAWAEIEHDLGYKNNIETPREVRRDFYRLAGLLETADKEFVDIRNKISEYKKNIEKRIEDKEETIFIDKISLEAYVKSDSEYNELVSKISKELNMKFRKETGSIPDYIEFLNYMNYKTINQLKEDIGKNAEKIFKVAKAIIRRDNENIPKLAILLYFCYVRLAEREKVVEEFEEFFSTNNIRLTTDENMEKFVGKIINACKKI